MVLISLSKLYRTAAGYCCYRLIRMSQQYDENAALEMQRMKNNMAV